MSCVNYGELRSRWRCSHVGAAFKAIVAGFLCFLMAGCGGADSSEEAKKAKEMKTQGLNPDGTPYVHLPGMDAPPPTAMKRNPVTGEMEEFHSEALKVSGLLHIAYIHLAAYALCALHLCWLVHDSTLLCSCPSCTGNIDIR